MSKARIKPGQGLAHRRVAADDQCVARRVGGDLAALGDIGLEHFCQILGRGVAQWHDLRPAIRLPSAPNQRCWWSPGGQAAPRA